jgi:hypothetical protein
MRYIGALRSRPPIDVILDQDSEISCRNEYFPQNRFGCTRQRIFSNTGGSGRDRPIKTPPCPSKKGLRNRWIVSFPSAPGGSPVPVPCVADDVALMERRAGKEGVPNPWSVPSEEPYAGSHQGGKCVL